MSTRRQLIFLRILRPLLHVIIIMGAFWAMYELRQVTDLIPFVQLRIPQIDVQETMLFAALSAVLFVITGILVGMYELYRPLHNYYSKFLQTRVIRLVASSFIAFM